MTTIISQIYIYLTYIVMFEKYSLCQLPAFRPALPSSVIAGGIKVGAIYSEGPEKRKVRTFCHIQVNIIY